MSVLPEAIQVLRIAGVTEPRKVGVAHKKMPRGAFFFA
jgi:hypothetical protein